ncbi:MAG: S8 family serine peptidase, partial [Acidobacteria bacterium]|nr:S8 family serine peptidase [Acidobacteriota bacterium]
MKTRNRPPAAALLASLILLVTLCAGIRLSENTGYAQSSQRSATYVQKLSLDLNERVQGADRLEVILQLNGKPSGRLNALLNRNGVHVRAQFRSFNFYVIELPASAVEELSSFNEVAHISLNNRVESFGHVSSTAGADAVRTAAVPTTSALDGTSVGIAILDSGIDLSHKTFLDKSNNLRVLTSRDFTGEGRVDDPYGHGTHVASIAAGNGRISNAEYIGIAPNANIINLRVLNSQGAGTVSWVLSALDWIMVNRALYNIRVVNMSLGMPAVDSYRNDPVCLAVRRLVNSGVVVIASAGNNGKNSAGQKIYGQIKSPGNEPSAITIGAANTFGTDVRNDDTVTSFSSRGPTRSFWTDAGGTKHYDNLIKPDIVAPGNKLVYAEAVDNLLVRLNPQLDAGVSPVDNRKMMFMNGTSMAAPVAAGAAALLLQANPSLTPNLVKMILMYTAQTLANCNMFEQGAGELNIEGAVRLARLVRRDLSAATPLGAPLLTTLVAPV